jgi:hypothetical protein
VCVCVGLTLCCSLAQVYDAEEGGYVNYDKDFG